MIDDIMLQEEPEATMGSEPDVAWPDTKESAEKLRPPKLEHDSATISSPARRAHGIVVPQKIGLDMQQVTDLRIQIEIGAQVARICQRLR